MKYIIQVLFVIITFNVCYGQESKTYTIKTEKGKKIIENKAPLWKENGIELKFYRQIGKEEGKDENYLFYYPDDIALDSRGNIYVAEIGNVRIQKFDANLNYIKTIGRRGQGPGEFEEAPGCLEILRDTIYVQSNIGLLQVLTLDGIEIKRLRLPTTWQFCITKSGKIITQYSVTKSMKLYMENKTLEAKHIAIYDDKGILLKELSDYIDFGNSEIRTFNLVSYTTDKNDNIYVVYNRINQFEKHSPDGDFIYSAIWPVNYKIPVNDKAGWIALARGIEVDYKNRIWIRQVNKLLELKQTKSEDMSFVIFNDEGILLCSVPVPRKESFKIIGDSVYFIDEDETMCIYEYKIIEK